LRILLTAIGKRVQLIKHLKKENYIIGVDKDELIPGRYFVNSFFTIPEIGDMTYISALLTICEREKIDLLIPLFEKEFLILDSNREEFENLGTTLLLSNRPILEICNDKWNTYNFFKENSISTAKTCLIEDVEDKNINMKFPLILKPREGMGSKGIFFARNKQELSHLSINLKNYIVQEMVEGTEYTMDVLCDLEGKVLSIVPRQRLEVRAGEVVKSKSVKDIDLIEKTLDLVDKLNSKNDNGAIGPMNIQCIVNEKKDMRFIEINPRFGGGVPLTFESGVDYGRVLREMTMGQEIEPMLGNFKESIMLRFDDAIFI